MNTRGSGIELPTGSGVRPTAPTASDRIAVALERIADALETLAMPTALNLSEDAVINALVRAQRKARHAGVEVD